MGTNFYCRRIPTQDQLNEIADLVCTNKIDDAIDKLHEVNKRIHICKRSGGWQIGFDHNNGEYWQPTRESVNTFISQSDIIIFDEYKKEYTVEEFWNEISPGEYNRLVILLVEKATVWQDRLELELKTSGVKSLMEELKNE